MWAVFVSEGTEFEDNFVGKVASNCLPMKGLLKGVMDDGFGELIEVMKGDDGAGIHLQEVEGRIKRVEMESGIRVFQGEFQDESNFGDYKLPFDIDAHDLLFLNRKYKCTANVDKFSATKDKG